MAESAEGARLLSECRVKSSTEGSNPSLSATSESSPVNRPGFSVSCRACEIGLIHSVVFWVPAYLTADPSLAKTKDRGLKWLCEDICAANKC